jgi:hypothetical protein
MANRKSNTFRKAIRHLKSNQIDEKLQLLNEIPTNNTSGIYTIEPESEVQDPDVPGFEPADFTQDDPSLNGRDTTGLFLEDGTILTIEPPGDSSYILGPMASMWYAWGNFTTIGYIRQSDRRMVDLGRITGQLGSWTGTSSFVSYGQLTLEQAVWFRDTPKLNGADNNTPNYRAFYPGPPSNSPDQYGRYLCVITGTSKENKKTPPPRRIPPTMGGFDPNLTPGSANPQRTIVRGKKKGGLNVKTVYHGTSKTAADSIKQGGFKPTKTGLIPNKVWVGDKKVADKYSEGGKSSGSMTKNSPEQQSVMKMRVPKGSGVTVPGPFGKETAISKKTADVGAGLNPQRTSSGAKSGTTIKVTGVPQGGGGGGLVQPVEPWIGKTDPLQGYTWNPKSNKYKLANSYEVEGNLLHENKKRILREIKKPYVLPEQPKVKYKFKPGANRTNRTINPDLMKKSEVPFSFKKPEERMWGKYEKDQNSRFSQERKNEVLDHLGGSDHFWEYATETSRKKNDDIMYGHFGDKKIVRKEELKGDTLLFIADEKGKKESILQSELSIRFANELNKELFEKYFHEQEILQADKDPLFKRVSKRLKKEIHYPDKPAKNGYPNDPPPKMVNGMHPDLVDGKKTADRFNKLDPESARVMPLTGNPHIDKKVVKARKQPK